LNASLVDASEVEINLDNQKLSKQEFYNKYVKHIHIFDSFNKRIAAKKFVDNMEDVMHVVNRGTVWHPEMIEVMNDRKSKTILWMLIL